MGPGHQALRKGRASLADQIYFVTFATHGRTPHFARHMLAWDACALLTGSRAWEHSRLLAWVLMPDHWHGLLQLGEHQALPDCIGLLKGASARALRARHALAPVWATGFHDHALRAEEDMVGVARYIVANPVRAGLVRRVRDYPYWDAVWLSEPL